MRPRWGSNPGLTDRLIFGRNVTLTLTCHVKYLGVIFYKTWRLNIEMIEAKAFRAFI
jgi:hypothetical protein